jgi:GNAT superfamily N-acetyltransferase
VVPFPLMSRVTDEAALHRWHLVTVASRAADFVGLPADPIEELRPVLSGFYGDEDYQLYLGSLDGVPVAAVLARLPTHDNLDLANLELNIHPDHRQRGYGRWALETAFDTMRASGRTKALAEVPGATRTANPAAGESLGVAVGARRMTTEKRRMLDVERMSESQLAVLHADATAAAAGYSTIAWRDRTPERFLTDMAALRALMSTDPPQGELDLEPERWDADRYLTLERSYIERGRQHLFVAARDDSTGRLVGYSDLGVPQGASVGYQWDTIVRSEHRGHRLGLLLKLANLRALKTQLPEVRYLNTWNDDDNRHMVAVNERLGFDVMEAWSEWQVDL